MSYKQTAVLLVALLSAPMVWANAAKPTEAVQAADGADKQDEKLICRSEKVTGSRFARRVCHTQAQWDRLREAGAEATRRAQDAPVPIVSN